MNRVRSAALVILSVLAATVAVAWPCSYFFGSQTYYSVWYQTSPAVTRERAHWIWSNFGSAGLGWRTQEVRPPMPSRPVSERKWEGFPASATYLSNVHPAGAGAWHRIDYHSATMPMGTSTSTYGHLFVPYWLILTFLLISFWLLRRARPVRAVETWTTMAGGPGGKPLIQNTQSAGRTTLECKNSESLPR